MDTTGAVLCPGGRAYWCSTRQLYEHSYTNSTNWRAPLPHLLCIIIVCLLTAAPAQALRKHQRMLATEPPPSAPSDYYSQLVTLSSNVYREVTKAGPLPADRYDDKLFNQSQFQDWLLRRTVFRDNMSSSAPMSYKCGVFVNHHYKLVFIRNRKAASTTVLDTFKAACKAHKELCMRPYSREEMEEQGISHDEMWRTYFVISSTRNPWARAASGYDYTQERWPVKTGMCGPVPFELFCYDPYIMGTMANIFRCGAQGSFRGDDAWAYDFYHIEPAYHCMVDASGSSLSVNYLIRYEHLHEDFDFLIDLLNRRRDPALPELRGGRIRWRKQGKHVQAARNRSASGQMWREDVAALVSSDRHAVRYRNCGMACVHDIARFFARDIQLMQVQVPTQ